MVDISQPYTGEEIEFLQCLLDHYSEGGGIIDLGSDVDAFMAIVRKHVPRLTAEQANAAEIERLRERVAELEAGARAILHGPLDLARLNRALDGLDTILNRERDNATG